MRTKYVRQFLSNLLVNFMSICLFKDDFLGDVCMNELVVS